MSIKGIYKFIYSWIYLFIIFEIKKYIFFWNYLFIYKLIYEFIDLFFNGYSMQYVYCYGCKGIWNNTFVCHNAIHSYVTVEHVHWIDVITNVVVHCAAVASWEMKKIRSELATFNIKGVGLGSPAQHNTWSLVIFNEFNFNSSSV